MSSDADNELHKWNSFATVLLRKISEFIANMKANKRSALENYDNSHLQETFEFFKVPIRDIEKALANIYY
jgi:hypothetical protein